MIPSHHNPKIAPSQNATTNPDPTQQNQTIIKVIQGNLRHAKAASAVLCKVFKEEKLDIALIQEPWVNNNTVKGLGTTDDTVAAYVDIPGRTGGRLIVCAAYLPGEEPDPASQLSTLVDYSLEHRSQLIVGCDCNAHHTSWGSSDTNTRGEKLFDFLMSNNLFVANAGNRPTFVTSIRQEVLDITFSTDQMVDRIHDWHVSNETSMSDHRHIRFTLSTTRNSETNSYRDPRKTNWCGYRANLADNLAGANKTVKSLEQLETTVGDLEHAITKAFQSNCPLKTTKTNRNVPWWNKTLELLRKDTRRLFNRAKKSNNWDTYKEALTKYNNELRRAKRRSWQKFCGEIENLPQAARICKVISKAPSTHLGLLKKQDGSYTESEEETLELLAKTHFPDSVILDQHAKLSQTPRKGKPLVEDWRKASMVFKPSNVKWAINSFKPYKTGGLDGITPVLLQEGLEIILPILLKVFRASYAWGYIPTAWTRVKIIFIPKGGDRDKANPKSYRPISLTSFMLKAMEKVIDQHIRENHLRDLPVHAKQHAYQIGKSTESALMDLVDKLERAQEDKDIALCAFLDIEGAFDNTSTETILQSMARRGIDQTTVNWIEATLRNRIASTTLMSSELKLKLTRGCPQGGVLSPLEWTLVVDELLTELNDARFDTQGYADDLVVLVLGKCPSTISSLMQQALNIIAKWCGAHRLSVNASKTIIVPFTKKIKLDSLKPPKLLGETINYSKEVKYLGITLDQRLSWNKHIKNVIKKAKIALGTCCRLAGPKWGLKPRSAEWLYTTIARPIVTYGCVTWFRKTTQRTTVGALSSLQRLACSIITGAMSTAPTAALEALLSLVPLHIHVQAEARLAMLRSAEAGRDKWLSSLMRNLYDDLNRWPVMAMPRDATTKCHNFHRLFSTVINPRSDWESGTPQDLHSKDLLWFTDGSKKDGQAGAGLYGERPRCRRSLCLGKYANVFQAEVYAIIMCVHENLRRAYKNKKIIILSDSQAAIKAVSSDIIDSKLVQECVQLLNRLSRTNRVTLGWVPGHCGIDGNEAADAMARLGAEGTPTGPEPICGVPKCTTRNAITEWKTDQSNSYWKESAGLRHSKALIQGFNKKFSVEALSLSRTKLRILTRTLTGHCKLNKHAKLLRLCDSSVCRFCNSKDETPIHLLCECEAIHNTRYRHLGGHLVKPQDIVVSSPKTIVQFMTDIGLGEVL